MGGVPDVDIEPPVIFRADTDGPPPMLPASTTKKYHPAESVSVPEYAVAPSLFQALLPMMDVQSTPLLDMNIAPLSSNSPLNV